MQGSSSTTGPSATATRAAPSCRLQELRPVLRSTEHICMRLRRRTFRRRCRLFRPTEVYFEYVGDFCGNFPVAEQYVFVDGRLYQLHSSLRVGESTVHRSKACSRYHYVGLGAQAQSCEYRIRLRTRASVSMSAFSPNTTRALTPSSFFASSDSHVYETLRIVLGLNLKYTPSRSSDVARKHRYISYKSSACHRQEVLLIYYHSLFRCQILVCDGLGLVAYLDGSFTEAANSS